MVTIHLTPQQETVATALIETGYYKTISELGRAAFEKFLSVLSPPRKLRIAIHLYAKGEATVSRVAEIPDIPLHEARQALREEGVLREASDDSPDETRAKADAGAAKFRK